MKASREVAVVLVKAASANWDTKSARYGVRVRRRVLGCLWWGAWRKVQVGQYEATLSAEEAHALAYAALEHGWVECYAGFAEPLIGKQEE